MHLEGIEDGVAAKLALSAIHFPSSSEKLIYLR
jgi:hypothetical protein